MSTERAVLAGGCFWGMQDLIRRMPGVLSTRVGYTGGHVANATYRNHDGHAEAIEIVFDPAKTSYRKILEFFFQIHDPSTMNRQGNDRGTSYRSAIFHTSDEQRRIALDTIADVDASGLWPGKVVTEVAQAAAVARSVGEDVAEMAVAMLRPDLDAHHAVRHVLELRDVGGLDRLGEARPPASRFIFVGRCEQRLAGDDVDVDAGLLVVQQRAGPGPFRAALLRHIELFGGELGQSLLGLLVRLHVSLLSPPAREPEYRYPLALCQGADESRVRCRTGELTLRVAPAAILRGLGAAKLVTNVDG